METIFEVHEKQLFSELHEHACCGTDASKTIQEMINAGIMTIPQGTYVIETAIEIP